MSKFFQYESFVAIVKTGSVRLAAESLNRTPSAISKQIAHLEKDLGVKLFERSNKQMVLTSHGSKFFKTSNSILRQINDSEKQIKLDKETIAGDVKITLSKSLIGSNLSALLIEFAELHPHIRYHLDYSENVEDFGLSDWDFAFRIGAIPDSTRLIARELAKVTPTFFATPDYLAKHGCPSNASELSLHRIAIPPLEHLSSDVRKWLKVNNFNNKSGNHHRINDVDAIKSMVLGHACIGFNLYESIADLVKDGSVIPLFQNNKLPTKKLYLVYRKSQFQSFQLNAFKHFVFDKYGSTILGSPFEGQYEKEMIQP